MGKMWFFSVFLIVVFISPAMSQSVDKLNCGHDNDGDGIYSDEDIARVREYALKEAKRA